MAARPHGDTGKEVILNVQVLRGVAALLVIFVHIDKLLAFLGARPFGEGGVDIFFVISGFIMVYTTIDTGVSSRAFVADRIARIVPPYWAITMAVFIVALVAPTLLQATHVNWHELFKSLAFIPFVKSNGLVQPILFVGWTLNYEMFFYLLFATGLLFPSRRWGIAAVVSCLVVLAVIGFVIKPHGVLARFYTNSVVLDFVLGILIGTFYRDLPAHANTVWKSITLFAVLCSFAAIVVFPFAVPDISRFASSAIPAGLIVGGALMLERWGWKVRSSVLLKVGAASFSIYLIHPFVTQIAQKSAALLRPTPPMALLILVVTLALVCIVGVLVQRFLERPLSGAARRLLKTRRLNPRVA